MNKQLGKKILLVLAAVMVMILLSSFKMQNEGDRSFKKIVLNKNKSVEYTVDVGKWVCLNTGWSRMFFPLLCVVRRRTIP